MGRRRAGASVAQRAPRPLVVLHVDDDPMNRRVVRDILTVSGHTAYEASSGEDALAQLALQAFDIVLMDIHMPDIGGVEVVERMRHVAGPNRDAPAIALTADVYSRELTDYLQLGFDGMISKPILVAPFLSALQRLASTRHEAGVQSGVRLG